MQRPPVIRTKAELKLKLQLLEALADIEIAMKIIKQSKVDENPLDTHYNSLKCDIQALDKTMADYKVRFLIRIPSFVH
jgi:poly [ADP-ribose] polymerase